MNGPADLTRGWLAKADSDLASARVMAVQVRPFDAACFHAQQAIEKYLKGFLAFRSERFPFTRDLEELVATCRRIEPDFPVSEGEVVELSADYDLAFAPGASLWSYSATRGRAKDARGRVRCAYIAEVSMILTDKIQAYVQELPATLQAEVLDFVEYLRAKARRTAPESVEDDRNGLSLALAMRGMEQEDTPYTLADIKVSFE